MSLQERVLDAVGKGIKAKALYARLPAEPPAVLDCAIAALKRAGKLELFGGVYRPPGVPGLPIADAPETKPRRTVGPDHFPGLPAGRERSDRQIRADLCQQLESMVVRWERLLAADRSELYIS